MYQASHISLHIKDKALLKNVSLSIAPGAFTAVVGPNGAGKSSLLKTLAHEYTAYQGDVTINGKAIRSYSARELSLVRAVLPQSSVVQFSFTAEEIITLGRQVHKTTRKENERIIGEVMELTGTEAFRHRTFTSLSGGEKQRVQLARVLAQIWQETVYPRYVLLDEPTSSLDIAQQQAIFSLAKQICSRNIGVMAIVHDLNQAAMFADQLYFLKEGQIVARGEALEVFTKPVIEETFCCRVQVLHDSCNNCPYMILDNNDAKTLSQRAIGKLN